MIMKIRPREKGGYETGCRPTDAFNDIECTVHCMLFSSISDKLYTL